jgi:putative hemolysin
MSQAAGVPTAGQTFTWRTLRFEVMDMDGRRVDKVLVTLIEDSA